jgi:G-patch domain/R3H domain
VSTSTSLSCSRTAKISRLALPPMTSKDRKAVHTLGANHWLKSKSVGKGDFRFTTLYKQAKFENAAAIEDNWGADGILKAKTFLPRMGGGFKGKGRGGGGTDAASYRNGEVVGGSAPELGIENKGRLLLEKMGWSSGTALGAHNNKGMLQPITSIIKQGKAGLG